MEKPLMSRGLLDPATVSKRAYDAITRSDAKRTEGIEVGHCSTETIALGGDDLDRLHFERGKGPHEAMHCVTPISLPRIFAAWRVGDAVSLEGREITRQQVLFGRPAILDLQVADDRIGDVVHIGALLPRLPIEKARPAVDLEEHVPEVRVAMREALRNFERSLPDGRAH